MVEKTDESTRTHYLFRRVYFTGAGVVAGVILAGIALTNWQIQWNVVALISLAGIAAGISDVLLYEKEHWSGFSACLFWAAGFFLLAGLMTIGLLIPYFILAITSKAFGIWQEWEHVSQLWKLVPIFIGGGFGFLTWYLLDDY